MKDIVLVANGDLRESANIVCWPAQKAMEERLMEVIAAKGRTITRGHPEKPQGHGFIGSQREGMDVFAGIDPDAPLIVAEAVWQYSHHVLAGLYHHRGPILTLANWSGQWPGLVGMLNLNGSLTKAGVAYSSIWSENFDDPFFDKALDEWLETGKITHETDHVTPCPELSLPAGDAAVVKGIVDSLLREKSIMGVFDEGCMGMHNAVIPDELLLPMGIFKERLSQSALYYAATQVPEEEARAVYEWYLAKGLKFHLGDTHEEDLTEAQVLDQCRMYIAAVRIADEYGCEAIGIQYQQGLKDLLPASDLVEGTLNSSERPDVTGPNGVIRKGEPIPHFNEVDECAGLDGLLINRLHKALGQPVENTLHDLRWGGPDESGTTDDYVWVFLISGAVPAEHNEGGWAGSQSFRQPPMYFPNGGGTLQGVAKPGEIVWSRIFVEGGALHMDIGRGQAISLPEEETRRRLDATTPQWPIMHAVLTGVTRDQMMARHKANHIQLAYATSAEEADRAMMAKAALAKELGMSVCFCGVKPA